MSKEAVTESRKRSLWATFGAQDKTKEHCHDEIPSLDVQSIVCLP